MGTTKIEWTDYVFSPWSGCAKVASGCKKCYAERFSIRQPKVFGTWGPNGERVVRGDAYWKHPVKWNREAEKAGVRRRVFCGSMCDVFEDRPDLVPVRGRLWDTILHTPWLDWLLLTKRPENLRRYVPWVNFRLETLASPWPNVWLGASASTQGDLDRNLSYLLRCPATVRFLSLEPLLEEVDFNLDGIDWLIIGSESGPRRRPCKVDWILSIRDQCVAAGVPLFIKQVNINGALVKMPMIDGKVWDQFPAVRASDPACRCWEKKEQETSDDD